MSADKADKGRGRESMEQKIRWRNSKTQLGKNNGDFTPVTYMV